MMAVPHPSAGGAGVPACPAGSGRRTPAHQSGSARPMSRPTKRVAVYAGSFDPPGRHHRRIAELLAARFDEVVIFPSGPRPDRPEADSLPVHRAVMADLNFRRMPTVRVELSDLEGNCFTPNHEFDQLFGGPGVEVSHVVPASAVRDGRDGRAKVQTDWVRGPELWQSAHFTILREPGEPLERRRSAAHSLVGRNPAARQLRGDPRRTLRRSLGRPVTSNRRSPRTSAGTGSSARRRRSGRLRIASRPRSCGSSGTRPARRPAGSSNYCGSTRAPSRI